MCAAAISVSPAQAAPVMIHADQTLPHPAPRAQAANWVAAPGRITVSLPVAGGMLRGWAYAGAATRPIILFFNGNGTTVEQNDWMYRRIAAASGSRVVVLDYRGFGFSSGAEDLPTFQRDAVSAYDALTSWGPVVVYGYSMGAAMATYVASQRPVTALVLAAPTPSASAELYAFEREFPGAVPALATPAPDATAVFAQASFVALSAAPLLVVHGTADSVVPSALSRDVFAASPVPAKFYVEMPGVPHNGAPMAGAALQALHDFMARI